MPKKEKHRVLYVLKYLSDHTDETHTASLSDIIEYLKNQGIEPNRRTVDEDIKALVELGYDIVCYRSTQNRYFLAGRTFELPELKLLIDAVQAARFIPSDKTEALVEKVASLASKAQADELKRNLYVNKQKDENKQLLVVIDQLNMAINQNKQVTFQYYEYDREGNQVLKYNGYTYRISPYALVWNVDNYYVVGYMEKYKRVIKYRVDKMCHIDIDADDRLPLPNGFDLSEFVESMFLMYGDKKQDVTLRCAYSVIGKVIDRFGTDIKIIPLDDEHFEITESVLTGSTFYSWMFNYAGKITITAPEEAKKEFREMLQKFENDQ